MGSRVARLAWDWRGTSCARIIYAFCGVVPVLAPTANHLLKPEGPTSAVLTRSDIGINQNPNSIPTEYQILEQKNTSTLRSTNRPSHTLSHPIALQ
jgi:hypothetical protein